MILHSHTPVCHNAGSIIPTGKYVTLRPECGEAMQEELSGEDRMAKADAQAPGGAF